MKQTLIPRKTINSEGKIAYSESFQAWNTIKLKKELFSEFPQLKEKRANFSYELIYPKDVESFEDFVKEIKKKKIGVMPMLLFLYKEN